jgi:hypothetical protein
MRMWMTSDDIAAEAFAQCLTLTDRSRVLFKLLRRDEWRGGSALWMSSFARLAASNACVHGRWQRNVFLTWRALSKRPALACAIC